MGLGGGHVTGRGLGIMDRDLQGEICCIWGVVRGDLCIYDVE